MICYIAQKEKHAMATAMAVVGEHSRVTGALLPLLPSDNIDFTPLPAQSLLAGNSFNVRCHVTSK